jgi:hypothetical protein
VDRHEAAELLAEGRDRAEARLGRDALDGVVGRLEGLLRVAHPGREQPAQRRDAGLLAKPVESGSIFLRRMPPLGTEARDDAALARLRRWISELPRP